jgi:hypothetical protein
MNEKGTPGFLTGKIRKIHGFLINAGQMVKIST